MTISCFLSLSLQTEGAVVDPAEWKAPASTEFPWGENQKSSEGSAENKEAWLPLKVED